MGKARGLGGRRALMEGLVKNTRNKKVEASHMRRSTK